MAAKVTTLQQELVGSQQVIAEMQVQRKTDLSQHDEQSTKFQDLHNQVNQFERLFTQVQEENHRLVDQVADMDMLKDEMRGKDADLRQAQEEMDALQ